MVWKKTDEMLKLLKENSSQRTCKVRKIYLNDTLEYKIPFFSQGS